MIPLIKLRNVWFAISGVLFIVSIVSLAIWGLKFGIDFTGGSIQEIHWNVTRPANQTIEDVFKAQGIEQVIIQSSGDADSLMRFKEVDEDTHKKLLDALRAGVATKDNAALTTLQEKSFSSQCPCF